MKPNDDYKPSNSFSLGLDEMGINRRKNICTRPSHHYPGLIGSTIVDGPELQSAREVMQVTNRNRVTWRGHVTISALFDNL